MLIRDTAYNSLLKQERQALHGSIATALLDQFPETADSEPELLAYHLTEAGLAAQAIPLWGLAGQRAAAGDAHVEAAAHLHTALALLRQLPADQARAGTELQLLIGLAVSLAASRGYSVQEVGDTLAAARAICDAMGNVAELFAVVRNLCSFSIVACDLQNAEKTARTCLEIAARTGDPVHRMEADYAYGYIMSIRGEFAAAREYLERVVRLYDEHDGDRLSFPSPQDPLTGSLGALLFVLLAMGDAAGLDGVCAALEAHVTATGRMFDKVYRLSFLCGFEIARGHYALTEALADEALGLCAQHGYSTWGTHAKLYKAIAIGHQGRLEEGLELARSGIAESDRLGNLAARGFYLGEIAELQAQAGDMTTALRTIDSAIATTLRYGDHYVLAPLRIRRAAILARCGASPDLCAKAAREAIETAEAQNAAGFIWLARSLLAEPALAS
jgi:tetratricopeptide (TPR) repeat protein